MSQEHIASQHVYWQLLRECPSLAWAAIINWDTPKHRQYIYTLFALLTGTALLDNYNDGLVPVWVLVMVELLFTYWAFNY